jgi:outer membrane immunogenic protein
MKKLMLASVGLAALVVAAPAMAADLPAAPVYKAPAVVPMQIYDWTGFYVGLNGGYSWGRSASDFTFTGFPLFSATQNLNGWVAGGQAGYNWQFNRNWIFGVEADLQATGQKGTLNAVAGPACVVTPGAGAPTTTTCTTSTASLEQKLPWLGTGRLRLGFLPNDHWMLYVTGGVAVGEVETDASLTTTTTTSFSINGVTFPGATTTALALANANTTRVGWTVGAGTEWVISGPWTAKLEYLYVDLGNVSNTFVGVGPIPTVTTSSHVTDNIVRVGLNYRFGSPVVARY